MAKTPAKIRNFQRKLYIKSKLKGGTKFYSLYDKVCREDILQLAYRLSKANKGAPGVDNKTFEDIERNGLQAFLQNISEELKARKYKPLPIRRKLIPKPDGKMRPLGISTIRDRVVQTACKIVMEPIFEPHLHQLSFGYRPKRSPQQAIVEIQKSLKEGYTQIYEGDLSAYFDTIPHGPLMDKIRKRISDQRFLSLIYSFLVCPAHEQQPNGKIRCLKTAAGTPQGNCLSPLLANIYLNDFCKEITTRTPCKIISFADDFVIMHKQPFTRRQTAWFEWKLSQEGLRINRDKTKIVDMRILGSEFTFLGFTFKKVKGFIKGTQFIKIQPSKKSQIKFKEAIRKHIKHRTSLNLHQLINRVNPIIRGWGNYFRGTGYPRQVFFKMDWFVVARFYKWSTKLSQRKGKYLAQDAWRKLAANGLIYLQPCNGRVQ